jgi:hypothetical protein
VSRFDPAWEDPAEPWPTTTGPLVTDGVKDLCAECVTALPTAWYADAKPAEPEHDLCDVCNRRVVPTTNTGEEP